MSKTRVTTIVNRALLETNLDGELAYTYALCLLGDIVGSTRNRDTYSLDIHINKSDFWTAHNLFFHLKRTELFAECTPNRSYLADLGMVSFTIQLKIYKNLYHKLRKVFEHELL